MNPIRRSRDPLRNSITFAAVKFDFLATFNGVVIREFRSRSKANTKVVMDSLLEDVVVGIKSVESRMVGGTSPGEGVLMKLVKAKGGQEKAVEVSGLKQVGVTRSNMGSQVDTVQVGGHEIEVTSNERLHKMARGDGRGNGSDRDTAEKAKIVVQVDTEQVDRARLCTDGEAGNTANFNDGPNHVGVVKSMASNERRVHQDADATRSLVNTTPKGGCFTTKLDITGKSVTKIAMGFLQTDKIAVLKQVDNQVVFLRTNGGVEVEEGVAAPR